MKTIAVLVLVAITTANLEAATISAMDLFKLGSVDGKTYVADWSRNRTWTEAKAFCLSLRMQLATVTSSEQRKFLGNSASQTDFSGYFWTGARDAQTVQQFVWDNTKLPINSSYVNLDNIDIPIATCVYFHVETVASPEAGHFHIDYCEKEYGTLCEAESLPAYNSP